MQHPVPSTSTLQSMPSNSVSLGLPVGQGQLEGGRLPPIERMGFRAMPGGGNDGGDGSTPKKRRKKKSKRIKPKEPHDDSDSV